MHKAGSDQVTAEQIQEMIENVRKAVSADSVLSIVSFKIDGGTTSIKSLATRNDVNEAEQVALMIQLLMRAVSGVGVNYKMEFAMRYPGGDWIIERAPDSALIREVITDG